jgi:hypothetical protein
VPGIQFVIGMPGDGGLGGDPGGNDGIGGKSAETFAFES